MKSLNELRDELAEKCTESIDWTDFDKRHKPMAFNQFCNGFDAALAAQAELANDLPAFDEEAAYAAGYTFSKRNGPSSAATKNEITQDFREGARYQHAQDAAALSAMKSELETMRLEKSYNYEGIETHFKTEIEKLRAENDLASKTNQAVNKSITQQIDNYRNEIEKLRAENNELKSDLANRVAQVHWKCIEIEKLETEVKEQCHINGIGANRELKLLAQLEKATDALEIYEKFKTGTTK